MDGSTPIDSSSPTPARSLSTTLPSTAPRTWNALLATLSPDKPGLSLSVEQSPSERIWTPVTFTRDT